MFIFLFFFFPLYHMSPRDSVITYARISVTHILGSFPHSATFYPTYLLPKSFRLGNFSPFHHFLPNSLFLFLSAIRATSSFFSLLPQLAFSLPVHNWSIFPFFLSFAPTCFFTSCPQLEHLLLFPHFCPNLLFHL